MVGKNIRGKPMDFLTFLLDVVNAHPTLSRLLIDGSLLGGFVIYLYRGEKTAKIVSRFLSFIGTKMITTEIEEIKEWVTTTNGAMEDRIKAEFSTKITEVENKVEEFRQEGIKRDLFARADYYHDEILLQADKMRQAKKFPLEERAKNLYKKVKWYKRHCEENPDYDNGVCEEACDYIIAWYKNRHEKGDKYE